MTRARYSYEVTPVAVVIVDSNAPGCASVTNDIENVLRDIAGRGIGLDSRVVVYQDSMGCWDGVETRNDRFVKFVLLGKSTSNAALAAMLAARSLDGGTAESF